MSRRPTPRTRKDNGLRSLRPGEPLYACGRGPALDPDAQAEADADVTTIAHVMGVWLEERTDAEGNGLASVGDLARHLYVSLFEPLLDQIALRDAMVMDLLEVADHLDARADEIEATMERWLEEVDALGGIQ